MEQSKALSKPDFRHILADINWEHGSHLVLAAKRSDSQGLLLKSVPFHPGLLSGEHYTNAIRYALSLPGVACAVIGLNNTEELYQAVEAVTNFSPLSDAEHATLEAVGERFAAQWGEHLGRVE